MRRDLEGSRGILKVKRNWKGEEDLEGDEEFES